MPLLCEDLLLCSFRFLGRTSQLVLRLVCRKFRGLVDEVLARDWRVVLLPRQIISRESLLGSLRLGCSAANLSVKCKVLLQQLLEIGAVLDASSTSSLFPNLRHLDLQHLRIARAEMVVLSGCSIFPNLTSLNCSNNLIGPSGVEALAESLFFPNLISLDLSQNMIGPTGIDALARSSSFPNLTSLDVSGNQIGPEGMKSLALSSFFPKVSSLNIRGNKIGPA
eukprot:RCo040787